MALRAHMIEAHSCGPVLAKQVGEGRGQCWTGFILGVSGGQGESCGELLQHVPLCQVFSLEGRGETGWDLGPFAPELHRLHWDTPLPEQQNTKKPHGTKNNPTHAAVGANSDPKDTKKSKHPTVTFEEPGAKTGCREQKQGTAKSLAQPKRWQSTQVSPRPDPRTHPYLHPHEGQAQWGVGSRAKEPVASSLSPCLSSSVQSLSRVQLFATP